MAEEQGSKMTGGLDFLKSLFRALEKLIATSTLLGKRFTVDSSAEKTLPSPRIKL